MKLLGRISDEYKNVGIDELARLRRELPLVLDRTTFITYQCAREDSRKLRAKFYDALVESRKSGKFLSLAKFAIENGISNAPLYGWLDAIIGVRVLEREVRNRELTRDEFVYGRVSNKGKRLAHFLLYDEETRAAYYDWFIANRNNPNRETMVDVARRLNVKYSVAQSWRDRLGGFQTERAEVVKKVSRVEMRRNRLVEALSNATRPYFSSALGEEIGWKNLDYEKIQYTLGKKYAYLLDRVITRRAVSCEWYNEMIDYINSYEAEHGVPPTLTKLHKFNFTKKLRREALANRKKIELTGPEKRALVWFIECEEAEFHERCTSEPYIRDEDWLVRVEDEGYKGFEFTGEYWTRYRKIWEKKRERELRHNEYLMREDIRAGRDVLETQCYGPLPRERKISPIYENIIRFLRLK